MLHLKFKYQLSIDTSSYHAMTNLGNLFNFDVGQINKNLIIEYQSLTTKNRYVLKGGMCQEGAFHKLLFSKHKVN